MRRPIQRRRKATVDDKLITLFRAAVPAMQALRRKGRMTAGECEAAHAAIYAFEKAAGVKPWEHGPLEPYAEGHWAEMRKALMKAIDAEDGRAA
jgi:hypothetical protein